MRLLVLSAVAIVIVLLSLADPLEHDSVLFDLLHTLSFSAAQHPTTRGILVAVAVFQALTVHQALAHLTYPLSVFLYPTVPVRLLGSLLADLGWFYSLAGHNLADLGLHVLYAELYYALFSNQNTLKKDGTYLTYTLTVFLLPAHVVLALLHFGRYFFQAPSEDRDHGEFDPARGKLSRHPEFRSVKITGPAFLAKAFHDKQVVRWGNELDRLAHPFSSLFWNSHLVWFFIREARSLVAGAVLVGGLGGFVALHIGLRCVLVRRVDALCRVDAPCD